MANTFSQIYLHYVFAVKGRMNLITENDRVPLEKYICGIVSALNQKVMAIYCMPDHTHLFVSLKPDVRISDLVRDVKSNSSTWMNANKRITGKFAWQEGYGVFSYAKSQKDVVIKYILNQPEHHQKKPFRKEYIDLLYKFGIEYDEKYLFEWFE